MPNLASPRCASPAACILALTWSSTEAHHGCHPAETVAEARHEASLIETSIYDSAASLEDYHRKNAEKIQQLLAAAFQSGPSLSPQEDPRRCEEDYPTLQKGERIGPYTDAVYHSEGLYSVVYKATAHDDSTYFGPLMPAKDRLVALKVTLPSMMQPPHDSRREARILARCASDNVIPVLETFRHAGTSFVIAFPFQPFVFDEVLHGNQLSKAQIKIVLRDIFSALAFIHGQGIIHRDVKPSNILLESLDGPAYLSDFGIAWAPGDPGSEAPEEKITDVGTTCYRPPELLFGNRAYGCSLDLWAAGCTVAEALVPGHPTLFDSGELGSDLALIHSIFTKLGTPDLAVWPEAATFHDWGKMQFREYPRKEWAELLLGTTELEQDLVSRLVRYESGERMTAEKVLEHPYFQEDTRREDAS